MALTAAESRALYRRLLGLSLPYWRMFVLAGVGMILYAATDTAFAWLVNQLLKAVAPGELTAEQAQLRDWIPLAILLLFIVRGIGEFASTWGLGWISRRVIMTLRQQVFDKFLTLPARFFDQSSSGVLLSRLTFNIEQIAESTSSLVTVMIREVLTAAGLIVYMVWLSPPLAMFIFLAVPLMAGITRTLGKLFRRYSARIQQSMGDVTRVAQEAAGGLAAVAAVATSDTVRQSMDLGDFGGFRTALLMLMRPLRQLTNINATIQRGLAAGESVYGVLDQSEEPDHGRVQTTRVRGDVEFCAVGFTYDAAKGAVLRDIDLRVAAGETIAIVGRSGSGKTTLVNLLPRFYEPDTGQLLVDGVPIADYGLEALRSQISVVSQEVTLFNDTVANNIAYGALNGAPRAEIERAVQAAHLEDLIAQLPDGLDTVVGDRGLLLSGGQRQRIAIARALLKDAPILILDEATSALDTESERHIQLALDELMANRTTFVIAHRLSTVENADRILVMAEGRIVESGTHAQLLAAGGIYAGLYRLQFRDE